MVSGKTVTISRIVTKFSVTKSRIHCIHFVYKYINVHIHSFYYAPAMNGFVMTLMIVYVVVLRHT